MTNDVAPDPGTFDLIGAIDGTVRPETEVRFIFDERAAQTVANIEAELSRLATLGKTDEYDELDKVKDDLIKGLEGSIYTVTVRGISRKVKKAIMDSVTSKFPDKSNAFGISESNVKGIEYLNVLNWQAYISKIVDPSGNIKNGPLADEEVTYLLDNGPEASLGAVALAIEELNTGPKSGYEQIVQGLGFLSEH